MWPKLNRGNPTPNLHLIIAPIRKFLFLTRQQKKGNSLAFLRRRTQIKISDLTTPQSPLVKLKEEKKRRKRRGGRRRKRKRKKKLASRKEGLTVQSTKPLTFFFTPRIVRTLTRVNFNGQHDIASYDLCVRGARMLLAFLAFTRAFVKAAPGRGGWLVTQPRIRPRRLFRPEATMATRERERLGTRHSGRESLLPARRSRLLLHSPPPPLYLSVSLSFYVLVCER